MDIATAIPVAVSMITMAAVSRVIYRDKLKAEREKRRELIIENAKLRARINSMDTDQQIACGAAIRYDELVRNKVEALETEIRYKDQLLHQRWRNAV